MESSSKPYAVLAVAVPAAVTLAAFLMGWSTFQVMYVAIIAFCCIPIICMGLCQWIHGNGYRFLNVGVDWSSKKDKESREIASRWGKWIAIGTIVLMWACALIISNLVLGLVLMGLGVVMMIAPIFKGLGKGSPLPSWSKGARVAVVAVSLMLAAVPFLYMAGGGLGSSESVDVSLGEDRFTIRAPFFDHSFSYDEVDDCQFMMDFDKGQRMMGYHSGTISSGHYKNGIFGEYELAAYSQVVPCIVFSVDGQMYAFNQSSVDLTMEMFEKLVGKLRRPRSDRGPRYPVVVVGGSFGYPQLISHVEDHPVAGGYGAHAGLPFDVGGLLVRPRPYQDHP